jgi:ABC-type nickel/cobalt efflux system permease component RcnA
MREAAPTTTGLGGTILAVQSSFYRSLQAAVLGLKESGGAFWSLVTLGLAYGVFHAAGPGHGKAVIAAYLVANERALLKGFALSLAAALVQALVAILLVGVMAILLQATAGTISRVTSGVELASFAVVALLGLVLTWRKAGKLLGVVALARDPLAGPQAAECDHVHLPPPEALDRLTRWRETAGVVLAAGIRPCSGAVVVLVFALSQGLLPAGIAATFAMALGTALTTGAIAALAVFAKGLALRAAGGRGARGAVAMAGVELLAAAFVLVLGASLLSGFWSTAGS